MALIKISMSYATWPIVRQAPGGLARWGNDTFDINEDAADCDAWVVLDNLQRVERRICPAGRRILINLEPPNHAGYHEGFLAQFDLVVTCGGHHFQHPGIRESFPLQPWYFGLHFSKDHANRLSNQLQYRTYDDIKIMQPEKKKVLSVVCSSKVSTEGHKKRLEFVQRLKMYFGDQLDWFGNGIRPITDKADAILDYKYHIAIENGCYPHYWTEKLADAYLGWAMPIYAGCPNIEEYFDKRSLVGISLDRPDEAIKIIATAINNETWERAYRAICDARELVLDKYNVFPMISKFVNELSAQGSKRPVELKPNSYFVGRIRTMLRHARTRMQFGFGITKALPFLRKI